MSCIIPLVFPSNNHYALNTLLHTGENNGLMYM